MLTFLKPHRLRHVRRLLLTMPAIGTLEQLHAEEYASASAWLSDNDEGQSDDDDDMPSLQSVSDFRGQQI